MLYLVSKEAPTRVILCAGAGTFERAYITMTAWLQIGGGDDAAERVAENFEAISDRGDEVVPMDGTAQGLNEVGKAMGAVAGD